MADRPRTKFMSPRHWTIAQKLAHYVDRSGGPDACWPWMGGRNKGGYGVLSHKRRSLSAHRCALEEEVGSLPEGTQACHRCDYKPCCNPSHLFAGTGADNMADKMAKGRHVTIKGSTHVHAKLTEADVLAIRASADTHAAVAKRYGVAFQTVSDIRRGKRWGWLQPHQN